MQPYVDVDMIDIKQYRQYQIIAKLKTFRDGGGKGKERGREVHTKDSSWQGAALAFADVGALGKPLELLENATANQFKLLQSRQGAVLMF